MTARGLPVVLLLQGTPCLVVGGGKVAARKVATLLVAGAQVTVVAPRVDPELAELGVVVRRRRYEPGDLDGQRIVMAATGDPAIDAAVYADAHDRGVLVNAADDAAHCDFTLPAVARRGPVSVAVATDGTSPALARWLRDHLEAALPDDLEVMTAAVARARQAVHSAGRSTEGLAWTDLIEQVRAAGPSGADAIDAVVDAFVIDAVGRGVGPTTDAGGTFTV